MYEFVSLVPDVRACARSCHDSFVTSSNQNAAWAVRMSMQAGLLWLPRGCAIHHRQGEQQDETQKTRCGCLRRLLARTSDCREYKKNKEK